MKEKRSVSILINKNSKWEFLIQNRENINKPWTVKLWFFWWWMESWETPEEAFKREIKEELNLEIDNYDYSFEFTYNGKTKTKEVILNVFYLEYDFNLNELEVLEWDGAIYMTKDEILKNEAFIYWDKYFIEQFS